MNGRRGGDELAVLIKHSAELKRELVEHETGYARARERSLTWLRQGMDLGTGGHIGWSRDSAHER